MSRKLSSSARLIQVCKVLMCLLSVEPHALLVKSTIAVPSLLLSHMSIPTSGPVAYTTQNCVALVSLYVLTHLIPFCFIWLCFTTYLPSSATVHLLTQRLHSTHTGYQCK